MSLNALLIACADIDVRVQDVWANANPIAVRDPVPFYEYILSPDNTNGIIQAVSPGHGKVRTVNMGFTRRLDETAVTSQVGRDCEADGEHEMHTEPYTIDTEQVEKVSAKILTKDLAHLCQANDNYVAERLVHLMDAMDRKVASKISTEAMALVGTYSKDAITAYSIASPHDNLTVRHKDTSGNIVPGVWEKIDSAREMSGYDSFIGFGGQKLNEAARLAEAGCCTNYGLDIGELYSMYGKAYGYDRRLAAAITTAGQGDALFMERGSLQLLHYTQNGILEDMNFAFGFEAFTMVTPRGLPVDVLINVKCPGEINITVFSATKLVAKPAGLFSVTDNFDGTRGTGFVTATAS